MSSIIYRVNHLVLDNYPGGNTPILTSYGYRNLRIELPPGRTIKLNREPYSHINISFGTSRGGALPALYGPEFAFPGQCKIAGNRMVAVIEQQAFIVTGLPFSGEPIKARWSPVAMGKLDDGIKALFKELGYFYNGKVFRSMSLLTFCLTAYSLSQVDWQNLTLPQSLASVALCGLGMDPNLVA